MRVAAEPCKIGGMTERKAVFRTLPGQIQILLSLVFAAGAVALGGVGAVLLGVTAVCLAADVLVPRPFGTAGEAADAFDQLVRRRRLARWARFGGPLPVLDDVHPWAQAARRRDLGVCTIPTASLAGTVEPGKAREFDRQWRPDRVSQARWTTIWLGRRRGTLTSPVTVLRIDGAHWVCDGHHRVSVARHQGAASIEAEVVELFAHPSATQPENGVVVGEAFSVARVPEDVFAFIVDPANLKRWQTIKTAVEPLTAGPTRLGSRLRESNRVGPRRWEQIVEVVEFAPGRAFAVAVVEGPPSRGRWTLQPEGTGSLVRFEAEFRAPRAMRPIARRVIARQFRSYHRALRRALETRAAT
jgi:hypothetical protein